MAVPDFAFISPITVLSSFGNAQIDFVESVTFDFDTDVTQLPIEDGADITDHAVDLPTRCEIIGAFSDTSVSALLGSTLNDFTNGKGRAKERIGGLLEQKFKKEPLTLVTNPYVLGTMLCPKFKVINDSPDYYLKFEATFIQARLVFLGDMSVDETLDFDLLEEAELAKVKSYIFTLTGTSETREFADRLGILG